jgi:Fe-S cluster assembly ATP-binding protein
VPGVPVGAVLSAAVRAHGGRVDDIDARVRAEADRLAVPDEFLTRGVNDEFSGGEQKRMETLQLAVLHPKVAVLDELDSGLDVDALRDVARRVAALTRDADLGVIAITHYARLLSELRPDRVHILMAGRIVTSGGPELADRLEAVGYEGIAAELGVDELAIRTTPTEDPFADPGF